MMLDPIYWIIIAVTALLSFVTSMMVKSSFNRAAKVPLRGGMDGAAVARAILREEGIDDVQVVPVQGFLSDHYNPMTKTLALSPDVFHGRSAAAAGVAAHEVGHAIQHARGSLLMWARSFLVPAAQLGSSLGPWIIIAGILMGAAQGVVGGLLIAKIGVALFAAGTAFALVTVPVEFDASARAKERLVTLGLTRGPDEDRAVRSVLTAAGLTYVAAAISSILMLLYWAHQAGLLGGRRE